LKLIKHQCNKDIRKFSFSYRVVTKWNMLDGNTQCKERMVWRQS